MSSLEPDIKTEPLEVKIKVEPDFSEYRDPLIVSVKSEMPALHDSDVDIESYSDHEIKEVTVIESQIHQESVPEDCNCKEHSKDRKTKICDICNRTFYSKARLIKHIKKHKPKTYTCEVCKKIFAQKNHLSSHMRSHVTSEVKKYPCGVCNKSFSKQALKVHKTLHDDPFCCNVCGKQFSRKFTLDGHKNIHNGRKPFSCDICNKCFSDRSNLNIHKRSHENYKPFQCDICTKSFVTKSNMLEHKKTVHERADIFKYSCKKCNMRFKTSESCNKHQKLHLKSVQCDICNKLFTRKAYLDDHKKNIHEGIKPFSCVFCDKSFMEKRTLENHERIHTGELPFQCDVCKKYYRSKKALTRHKNKKHDNNV